MENFKNIVIVVLLFLLAFFGYSFFQNNEKDKTQQVEQIKEVKNEVSEEKIPQELNSAPELAQTGTGVQKDFPLQYQEKKLSFAGESLTVNNSKELVTALNKIKAGGTIYLNPGKYENIVIYGKIFPNYIKITSKDSINKAIISEIKVNSSGYIVFDDIHFSHTKTPQEFDWTKIFTLNASNNIIIQNSLFSGTDDANYLNDVSGIGAKDCKNISFIGNEFKFLSKGLSFETGSQAEIIGNNFHNLNVDGINIGNGVSNILVEKNHFSEFYTCNIFDTKNCLAHPDFLQIFNNNGKIDNTNIKILSNDFVQGKGDATQSIFIQANNANFINKNILIANNLIYNSHFHGISAKDIDGIQIYNNTVLQMYGTALKTDLYKPNINIFTSKNYEIKNNVSMGFNVDNKKYSHNNSNKILLDSNYTSLFPQFDETNILREKFYIY